VTLIPLNAIPVEITNHTDWWQPYVPPMVGLLGSLMVAAAAFLGVSLSNRTNLRAIEAADRRSTSELEASRERDFRVWQRDNQLRLSTEVVEAAIEAQGEYVDIAYSRTARLYAPAEL
jgi:hypothetical protein